MESKVPTIEESKELDITISPISSWKPQNEEYAMAVRDFKMFFKRSGRFVRQPQNEKRRSKEVVMKRTVKVIENALDVATQIILLENVQNHRKIRTKELLSEALGAIAVKKMMKRNSLENELRELKDKLSTLEKNKGVDLDCAKCHVLKIENEKLKDESTRLNKFEKSTHCLNEMLSNQKPSGDKLGLGFNSFEASSSGTKKIKFVKAQKKAYSDGGPINMGGPLNDQAAPKINMGPPPAMPGSEKTVSFQKSILGPRPKHIIVNKVKVPVACDNKVKQFYKPLSKPGVGFSKLNFRSKTPPPRRVKIIINRSKTPQPKRHVVPTKTTHGFPRNLEQHPHKVTCHGKNVFHSLHPTNCSNARDVRKIEESLNVTFHETPPPSKTSPLVNDDLDEEEAIREIEKKNLENVVEDETLEINEIVNIKESRNHPLENVIGNLNQRTLRSQA
ncbi:hypothetical protein Tco_0643991 [Tanacetum coccineum]